MAQVIDVQVPPTMVAKIIGKKGVFITKAQRDFGVKIETPSKQQCQSAAQFVIVKIHQQSHQSNMQGAVQFIQQKIPQAVVAGQGMGSALGGAAAAFGGGASAAAAGNVCIFLFRNNPLDNQLQLCLQQQAHGWDVPCCAGNHHQHLTQTCGGNNPAIPFTSCPPITKFESVAFQGKQMVHLAVPPASAWSNVWTPTQNAGPTVNSTPQQIFTCGASQVSWVNVGVAQATRGQQMHGSLSIWLQNSCDSAVVPAVQTLYASAGQATTVTAVAPNAVAGSPGGGGGAAAAVAGWSNSPQGQSYALNLQHICRDMSKFDPTTFLKVMELCFTPGDLQQVFKKWTAGGGTALPTPM